MMTGISWHGAFAAPKQQVVKIQQPQFGILGMSKKEKEAKARLELKRVLNTWANGQQETAALINKLETQIATLYTNHPTILQDSFIQGELRQQYMRCGINHPDDAVRLKTAKRLLNQRNYKLFNGDVLKAYYQRLPRETNPMILGYLKSINVSSHFRHSDRDKLIRLYKNPQLSKAAREAVGAHLSQILNFQSVNSQALFTLLEELPVEFMSQDDQYTPHGRLIFNQVGAELHRRLEKRSDTELLTSKLESPSPIIREMALLLMFPTINAIDSYGRHYSRNRWTGQTSKTTTPIAQHRDMLMNLMAKESSERIKASTMELLANPGEQTLEEFRNDLASDVPEIQQNALKKLLNSQDPKHFEDLLNLYLDDASANREKDQQYCNTLRYQFNLVQHLGILQKALKSDKPLLVGKMALLVKYLKLDIELSGDEITLISR